MKKESRDLMKKFLNGEYLRTDELVKIAEETENLKNSCLTTLLHSNHLKPSRRDLTNAIMCRPSPEIQIEAEALKMYLEKNPRRIQTKKRFSSSLD